MSNTPRTDRYELHYIENGNVSKLINLARELESELADMTKQRDALAEALQWYEKKVSDCRKVTPEGHFARYKLDEDGGKIAAKALAATKGGSDE